MQETRRQRLQSVILEEVSRMVAREVKDPRIPLVTFTSCEVTPEAEQATLSISILGALADPEGSDSPEGRKRMKECLEGLTSAAPFLRRQLAKILNIRHTPVLIFREDKGLANATRVHELLKQLQPAAASQPKTDSDDSKE